MSHNTYNVPLIILPRQSRQLASLIIVLHGIAILFTIFIFSASLFYKLLLVTVITASSLYYYLLYIKKSLKHSVISIQLSNDNIWKITTKNNKQYNVKLLSSSLLHRHLLILNFKGNNKHYYTILIFNDAVDADLARKVRARIRVESL